MSDLQWWPIAIAGGLQDSKPIPSPDDAETLENFALFRGRFALRAPLEQKANLVDDQGTPADITHLLALQYHVGKCYVVGYSAGQTDAYLYRLETDGAAEVTDPKFPNASPVATIWAGTTVIPRVTLTSFEGGSATAGIQRLYIADATGTYITRYWNSTGSAIADVEEDFDDNGTKEDLSFRLVFSYNDHMFGTDFLQSGETIDGLLRFSQPGLIPALEPGVTNNPSREWWFSDRRQVGSRGEKVVCLGEAGGGKILYKRRETYALFGYDAASFQLRRVSPRVGAVGPHAACALPDGRCVAWSDKGPHITDGQKSIDIGEQIRKRVNAVTFSEDTALDYSPDEGLVYCLVSFVGGAPTTRLCWDTQNERWLNEGTWKGTAGSAAFSEAFTGADTTPLATHDASWTDASSMVQLFSNKGKNVLQAGAGPPGEFFNAYRTVTGSGATEKVAAWADITLPSTMQLGQQTVGLFTRRTTGAGLAGILVNVSPSSATEGLVEVYHYNDSDVLVGSVTESGIAWATGGTRRIRVVMTTAQIIVTVEPSGGGAPLATLTLPVVSASDIPTGNICGFQFKIDNSITWDYYIDNFAVVAENVVTLAVNDIKAIPRDVLPAPAASPSNIAVAGVSDTALRLTWTNGDTAIDVETDIHRSLSTGFTPGPSNLVQTVASGVALWDDTGLTEEVEYFYKLIHRRNGQSSLVSTQASGKTAVKRPTSLIVSSLVNGIKVKVTNNSNTADLVVERKPVGGTYSILTTLAAQSVGQKTHDDTTATCGAQYTYRVKAAKATFTDSPYTSEATFTACSTAPDILFVTHVITLASTCPGSPNVAIAWKMTTVKESDTAKVYVNDNGGGFVLIATVSAQAQAYGGYTWPRRSGATGRTFQVRVEVYDGGLSLADTVDSTLSNESVDNVECPT